MFSHPLDTVDDLVIESSSEAEEYIHQIENKLSNRDDWSARADGIKLALSCLKGGICDYINTDYSFFVSDVAGCVSDLRSTLVRNGSLLIAASAQFFREKYMTSIKMKYQYVYSQLTFWEQIDDQIQYTRARKFLSIVPIVLLLLAIDAGRWELAYLWINLPVALITILPKLPFMTLQPPPSSH